MRGWDFDACAFVCFVLGFLMGAGGTFRILSEIRGLILGITWG